MNAKIAKVFQYFNVADMRDVGASAKWPDFCAACEIDPTTLYWFEGDGIFVVIDPAIPGTGAALRGFDFQMNEPVCVFARTAFQGMK